MNNDTTKTCKKCGNSYPATTEYFSIDKSRKDGLRSRCKNCDRKYYQANKDKLAEYRQANKDAIDERNRNYYQDNKDKISEYAREYRQANKDAIDERQRKYRQANPEKIVERNREYHQANKDKLAERQREYQKANPEKMRINNERRRARRHALPDTFTEAQWIACLEYFDYRCAVCGIEFDETKVHADHWIPLSSDKCTGTVATNMICLCASCNRSKKAILPYVWLQEKYDTDSANEILKRVQTYFVYIANTD